MQKCDFNQYSSVNMLHICSRTPFLENTFGELLLYIALNIEVINKLKYIVMHFNIINTFSNFIRDFCLVNYNLTFYVQ